MSVVGEFTVSAETFALAETLPEVPSTTVEFDRIVAHSPDWVMPYLWATGPEAELDRFEALLADDPTVRSAEATDSFADARLYKVTWTDDVARRLAVVLDHEGTILEAAGRADGWELKVRFGDREKLTAFHEHFADSGSIELEQLFSPSEPHAGAFNITAKQREALVAAYEAGYFESPRESTASEVAAQFGLSQQAFSERLRRGTAALVENSILTG